MKRLFSLTMALCALFFVACEQLGNTPNTNSKLARTSAAIMEFNAEGGNGEITYTIENPAEGVQVRAFCEAEWIDGLTTGEKVTFIVKENTSTEGRLATIEVTYGEECKFEVTVNQKGANGGNSGNNGGGNGDMGDDDVVELPYFYCSYYGTDYGTTTHSYYVVLSDCMPDADGWFPTDAIFYAFDLYSDIAASDSTIILPNGLYEFDPYDTTAANTIGYEYSYFSLSETESYYLTDALVEVSNNKFEAIVEVNGETHHIVYEGELYCSDDRESGDDYAYSNLTEDFNFNISGGNAYGYASIDGDIYGVGCNSILVELYEDANTESGTYIALDLLTNATSTSIIGTYTPYYTSSKDEYLFIEGYAEEDEDGLWLLGSWLMTLENDEVAYGPLAPITVGQVTILATPEAGVYSIILDCEDDAGYAIDGTFKGSIEFYTSDEFSAAPQKAHKKATTIAKQSKKVAGKSKLTVLRR